MEPSDLSPAAAARITALLVDASIDASYLAFVARHIDADDRTWRWCCGSNCDPCVQGLGRVVDQARQLLGSPPDRPPGVPKPAEPA